MRIAIYTHSAAVGPWVLLPDGDPPSCDAERLHGPLMLSRTIEPSDHPEINWAPLMAQMSAHAFATVDRRVFERAVEAMALPSLSAQFT